jgi:hypothetical protein
MKKLGIEVGLRGATCTLSKTPNALNLDLQTLFRMYAGLGAIPTAIGFAGTLAVSLLYGGPTVTPQSLAVSLVIGAALTTTLARYLDLHNRCANITPVCLRCDNKRNTVCLRCDTNVTPVCIYVVTLT